MTKSLAIFGATGRTGRQLVEQAMAAGHEVSALVRDPARLQLRHERLRVLRGDVLDPVAVQDAVGGADAVLSALGLRRRKAPPVCGPAVATVVKAMHAAEVHRLLVVSAAPLQEHGESEPLRYRLTVELLRAVLRDLYADLAAMEAGVRNSGLDWTILRPPKLTDTPFTGRYRTATGRNLPGGNRISRADLAAEMLRLVDVPDSYGTTVGIAY